MATITTLPAAPSRGSSSSVFAAAADTLLSSLAQFVLDANALAAQTSADSTNSANNASAAAGAASSAGASAWVSGFSYSAGNTAYSLVDYQSYRRKTAGNGTLDPSSDATNWARIIFTTTTQANALISSNTNLGGF